MGWFGTRNAAPGAVAADEVRQGLGQTGAPTILDVRTASEFLGDGHIPGAIHLPLDRLAQDLRSLDPGAEYVLVCRSGARSAQAQRVLASAGFARTKNMSGGMLRWHGPVVHDGPARR